VYIYLQRGVGFDGSLGDNKKRLGDQWDSMLNAVSLGGTQAGIYTCLCAAMWADGLPAEKW